MKKATKNDNAYISKCEGKQLLIESSEFLTKVKLSKDLKESVKMSAGKAGTLIVKNIPCTILNRVNQNGRIYSTEVVQTALTEAREAFRTKQLLSQACEHPEGSFVAPTNASHVVINAYIKPNVEIVVEGKKGRFDVLFQDWEILNTVEGKNLRALFEAECSIGTSIRGVGDMNGKYVEDYVLLGCDCVGNPSSSTFTRMPVSESVQVELITPKDLKETFTVSTSSTNVVRDLEAAAAIQEKLDSIGYGTITKTSTKVDEETDPKTGAQTSMTTLEAETSDDVATLDQALSMARNAMLNGVVNVDSITIENIKEEQPTESTENDLEKTLVENEFKEATEKSDEEDKNKGKKFVLKTPNGFVSMDGNTLVFTEDPKEALHFIVGKEESGLVHLSGVEKILDAMGVFDVEKYYRKDLTDISVKDDDKIEEVNILDGTPANNINGQPQENKKLAEENGSNTRYIAKVEMINDSGAEEVSTVPVSAVEMGAIISEVSNLWEMKSKKSSDPVNITVIDTKDNQQYIYNPKENILQATNANVDKKGAINPKMPRDFTNEELDEPFNKDNGAYSDTFPRDFEKEESVEPVEQDKNKLTVNVDDNNTIEKEFDSEAQAAVVKAGLENGKISGDVMLEDEENDPMYLTLKKSNFYAFENPEQYIDYFNKESKWLSPDEKARITNIYDDFKNNKIKKEYACHQLEGFMNKISYRATKDFRLDEETNTQYEDIEPGWYVAAPEVGISGPYKTEEEAMFGLEPYKDIVSVEYISPDDISEASISEKLYTNTTNASDDLVDVPLDDSVEDKVDVILDNIDWNTDNLAEEFTKDNTIITEDEMYSKVESLPETIRVSIDASKLNNLDDVDSIKNLIFDTASKESGYKINNANILSIE